MKLYLAGALLASSILSAQTEPPTKPPTEPAPLTQPVPAAAAPDASAKPVQPPPLSPLDLQREAARMQAQSVGAHLIPWTPISQPAAQPNVDCDPLANEVIAPLIDSAAKREQVDPKLIRAVIEQESGLKPCAVSVKGAQGLMQLMPGTAAQLSVGDAFEPAQNIDAGARYLKQLLDKYKGNVAQALAAYNAGPGEVDKAGGIPNIVETKTYVDAILRKVSADPPKPADK